MCYQRAVNRIIVIAVLGLSLIAGAAQASQDLGETFLLVWPTARSTALAGAMTALADEPDAAHWNPGGLGFQKGLGGCASLCQWLPGLYQGMYYFYGSGGMGLQVTQGMNLNVGADLTYMTTGETDVVDEQGNFLGRYVSYDVALGIHAGAQVTRAFGVGVNLKYIRSHLTPEWVWKSMPELGIDAGGSGNDVAADVGVLYRPRRILSLGLSLVNIGPSIAYAEARERNPLPSTLRIGGCFTPLDVPILRVRALLEADKILVGMFSDTTGTKSLGRQLDEELRDAWKSAGIEVTLLQLVTARFGYIEDLTGQRGGIVIEKEGQTYHYGLGDVLTRTNLGTIKSVGICWGLGLSYKDFVRLDVSDDSRIYDFPTSNMKFTFAANDIIGLWKEINSGLEFGWMY
jgi:hypothetical protein